MAPPLRTPAAKRRGPRESGPTQILAGRAFLRGRLQPVEIAIDDEGRIQSVGRVRTGAPRHDVGDSVILPAATDLHVHLREPSSGPAGESIPSGTVEAALGGVTLVGEMPNTDPPVTTAARLAEKEDRVRGRAAVDVLLYALPTVSGRLDALARHAGAFKLFTSPTTGVGAPPSRRELIDLLARLSELDLPVSVHAEDPAAFSNGPPPSSPEEWNRHRPPEAETAALGWLDEAPARLRLHVAHVTTAGSVQRLAEAGRSFEVTPAHLLLSDRSGTDARFKVNPPLRSESERRALWEAFRRGEVPCLASDHAPHPAESKALPFERAPSGMPGLETMLPLMLAQVRAAELSLELLAAVACDRPARWLGQPLGRIAPGHRANLIVVDFKARTRLEARSLTAPCGWTAFEGWDAVRPVEHWRDGERIVRDGEYVGRPTGRVVRPEFAPVGETGRGPFAGLPRRGG
jgi:dihydroorotase